MTTVLEITGDDKLIYESRGLIYQDMRNHEEANRDFNKAIELAPDSPEAYIYRGVSLLKLRKPD
jgi:tetratricopeptide (TPR) repeat protein